MSGVWGLLNVSLIGLSVWAGYAEMAPERLAHANPDLVFCTLVLVTLTLFSLGSVWYSLRYTRGALLPRQSFRRFSVDWWRDPLQCLFLSCLFVGGMSAGAAIRLPVASPTGFWMFMFFLCMFLGLLVGQFAVYAVYRKHIQPT
jgi:hypothetical protein